MYVRFAGRGMQRIEKEGRSMEYWVRERRDKHEDEEFTESLLFGIKTVVNNGVRQKQEGSFFGGGWGKK